jgi:hypothetical protein
MHLPNPTRSVHYAPTDPGIDWVKDPDVAIDVPTEPGHWKALTPNVIALPSGGFRMYYTLVGPGFEYGVTRGSILSAFSPDGDRWAKEPGVRLAPFGPDADLRVVCPDVIPLGGGGYRMYVEGQPTDRPSSILSATSLDGLEWEPEPGIRFGDGRGRYGSPRCLYTTDDAAARDRFRLYFHRYAHPLRLGLDAGNHIVSAISADGLSFEEEPGVRIEQSGELQTFSVYAPEVLRLGDGGYRMYYAGWTAEPVRGRIFTATSADGVTWTRNEDAVVTFGGRYDREKCSEPSVIRLPDGRCRMFYEACDEDQVWRILSCTTPGRAAD